MNDSMSDTVMETAAANRLRQLGSHLHHCKDFAETLQALLEGQQVTFDGVWGSGCALLAAELARKNSGTLVVVCSQVDLVDEFVDDLSVFTDASCMSFPAWEANPGERVAHDEVYGERLRTLKGLQSVPAPSVVVTNIQSLLQPCPTVEGVANSSMRIRTGDRVDVEALLRWFAENHFHATSAVELPGEFSMRGGILDIFAADWQYPIRVEFFDDEIESMREFEIASQRSRQKVEEIEVTVLEPADDHKGQLADFLPADSTFVLLEPVLIQTEGKRYLERLDDPANFHSVTGVMQSANRFGIANFLAIAESTYGPYCRMPLESVERFSGELSEIRSELDRVAEGYSVVIVADTTAESERLGELLRTTKLASSGSLHFIVGALTHGFKVSDPPLFVVSSRELFNRAQLRRTPRRRLGKAIDSFLDLREGDLVVHLAHGIGRYRGLKLLDKDGQVEEHLEIEFHGGTKIYSPASKIDIVQKYIGGTKTTPTLARIGGKAWVRQKKAAELAVVDLASDMIDMQAERATRPGIPFAEDSEWQQDFDASFPYNETPDQLTAIEAIRFDMKTHRPMDRLLCGDVGYGKTEVAMRAAFKAVDSGYQVALLAPTTILVEQHYHTFRERMAEFPFDIGKLSRFCDAQELRETREGLKKGRVDIVLGTHRLASKDVEFFNLGLVIIDEEQRFGVEVKERLKSLKSTVDILSMSATPIPRTLHMSLVGVRDISNLETPPEDRVAVETRVVRSNDELIRRAITRELNRGGQVYFVHNRVQDIKVVAQKLQDIVPEARIEIGHGQMNEKDLERVMIGFIEHKFDVLLATTIVESGLDIPNANTIFIDEADRYGLADLHQLRGRVGRYKHRGYCYLLIEPHKHVSPTAAKRLRAIEEFSEMGAGFSIAMRDLEIRGAGNLLGTQQSGHINAVGYELYCQLLEGAVRRLKKMPPKISIHIDVDLPGEAFLPPEYIPDMRSKIDFYRRLTRVERFDQIEELSEELVDRFGAPPRSVERLFELARLKMEAALWQISAVYVEDSYLVLAYTLKQRIQQLAKESGGRLRIVDDKKAYLPLGASVHDPDSIFRAAQELLGPVE